jgi:SAM domain (Sterile alpha motif)
MDVGRWLRNLRLGQYESAFIENAIDTDVLPELTEGDLEKLGIPLGHRKRLIKAIKAMAGGSPLITSEVGEKAPSDYSPPAERRHLTVMICDLVGLDCSIGPTRSRGHGRRDRCLSGRLRPYHASL